VALTAFPPRARLPFRHPSNRPKPNGQPEGWGSLRLPVPVRLCRAGWSGRALGGRRFSSESWTRSRDHRHWRSPVMVCGKCWRRARSKARARRHLLPVGATDRDPSERRAFGTL